MVTWVRPSTTRAEWDFPRTIVVSQKARPAETSYNSAAVASFPSLQRGEACEWERTVAGRPALLISGSRS